MYKATAADIQCFKDWLIKVPYLPQFYEDFIIIWFIEGAKGRMEIAKQKFDNAHRIRTVYPDIMTGLDIHEPSLCRCLSEMSDFYISKVLSKSGSMVLYSRIGTAEPNLALIKNFYKAFKLYIIRFLVDKPLVELLTKNWNGKFSVVIDMANITVTHTMLVTAFLKPSFELMFAMPFGVQSVHYVNVTPAFDKFVDVIKALTKKKIGDRIFSHRDSKSLAEFIDREALPFEYGGDAPTLKELSSEDVKWFKENRNTFVEYEAKCAAYEKLRPKTVSEDTIVGTFRKLEVD